MLFGGPAGDTAGALGLKLDLQPLVTSDTRLDALLFGESQGRALIAVAAADAQPVLAAALGAGVPAAQIGEVTADGAFVVLAASETAEWSVAELRRGWETCIEEAMKRPGISES
jgi:phosphoribosylformylglycinamidine (FGAM) synthase-like enzyme